MTTHQQHEENNMTIHTTTNTTAPTAPLRGADPDLYFYVEQASSHCGSVDWELLPGLTEDERAECFWTAVDAGVILDLLPGHAEFVPMGQCSDCKRMFMYGDLFVNGDSREWCWADNGNGCLDAHKGEDGSDYE